MNAGIESPQCITQLSMDQQPSSNAAQRTVRRACADVESVEGGFGLYQHAQKSAENDVPGDNDDPKHRYMSSTKITGNIICASSAHHLHGIVNIM